MASYFNADHGIDSILDKLKEKVSEGYSVLIFPEAHRSTDNKIHRFHRGAFYLVEKLQLDIVPVVVFGTGEFLGKGVFWGRPSGLSMKILKRITAGDPGWGTGYSERSKRFRKFFSEEYDRFMASEGTGSYYRKKLILNYIYKGPVLENYLRVKMAIENFYQRYNELLPRNARILDLGCGYGFMAYMLNMTAPGRKITGVDFDDEKIRVAQQAVFRNDHLEFVCADVTGYQFESMDVILLSDVLHYFSFQKQEELLGRCIEKLNPGGMIVIRDADSKEEKKHRATKFTEFFSTKVIGFNKTAEDKKELHFTSRETISQIASLHGLTAEVIREEQHTSNILMIIRK
jgi:2-polyprenyl-3-methyl-5-hydroxy-6-metoxy-1,4-benzoquinol methylase